MRVGIDVGGTFTDLVATDPRGVVVALKVPSTPSAPHRAVIHALAALLARCESPRAIEFFAHSTTIATNALLGQLGLELPRVALVTTDGFRDVIEIGRQNRSEVYNLLVERPRPLVAREDRFTVRERDRAGRRRARSTRRGIARARVLVSAGPRDRSRRDLLAALVRQRRARTARRGGAADRASRRSHHAVVGGRSAVSRVRALLHDRRQRGARADRRTVSRAVRRRAATQRRGSAALRDAQRRRDGVAAHVARAAGGDHRERSCERRDRGRGARPPHRGKAPALVRHGRHDREGGHDRRRHRAGRRRVRSGGTDAQRPRDQRQRLPRSLSVRRPRGSQRGRRHDRVDRRRRLAARRTALGRRRSGSGVLRQLRSRDRHRCQRRARPPQPAHLLGGAFPIDASRARDAVERMRACSGWTSKPQRPESLRSSTPRWRRCCASSPSSAASIRASSRSSRSAAAARCTPARWPTDLGVARVIVPPHPGLFSAHGLLDAPTARGATCARCCAVADELDGKAEGRAFAAVESRAAAAARAARRRCGDDRVPSRVRRTLSRTELRADRRARSVGTRGRVELSPRAPHALRLRRARRAHRNRQRASDRDGTRRVGAAAAKQGRLRRRRGRPRRARAPSGSTARFADVPVYQRARRCGTRSNRRTGDRRAVRQHRRTSRPAGRSSRSDDLLVLERETAPMIDPITVGSHQERARLRSEEMGIAVRNARTRRTSRSGSIIRARCSTARGRLIAQAEHIPVHLGSLPWGLRQMLDAVEREYGGMREGEMWVVNDPYITGTHLNDVTVIRPVFAGGRSSATPRTKRITPTSAARCRDRCRPTPPSSSPKAWSLPPMRLVRGDRVVDEIVAIVRANSRTPDARSGDLRAQIAGNYTGERRLLELCERYGVETFDAAIGNGTRRQRAPHARRAARARRRHVRGARLPRRPRRTIRAIAHRAAARRCATGARGSTTPGRRRKWTFRSTPCSASRFRACTTRCARSPIRRFR